MRIAAPAILLAAIAAAGFATAASAAVSDSDFIRASRCKGIAEGLGVDAADLTSFVRAEGRTRLPIITDQAAAAEKKARRDVAKAEAKSRFETELSGVCAAYAGAPKAVAAR
jgi:carbamoylphosphate synthase small subunit